MNLEFMKFDRISDKEESDNGKDGEEQSTDSWKNEFGFSKFVFEGPLDYEERKEQIFALLRWPLEAGLAIKAVSWLAEFDKFQKNVEYRIDESCT
uniref:Uncharacterized protein n=1 Tax=Globodera rostochiensis TaxID=31243 RepID=A0A914IF33_GLORO